LNKILCLAKPNLNFTYGMDRALQSENNLFINADKLLKIYPLQSQILNPDLLIANPILKAEQSA